MQTITNQTNYNMKRLLTILMAMLLPLIVWGQAHQVTFGKLTVEGREEPLGLDEPQPRFGWQLLSGKNDVRQISYRIRVSTEASTLVWDSGEVPTDSSQWVAYQGPALQPGRDYFWQVKVTTNRGATDWSPLQRWSTGLLDSDGWKGCWIGLDSITPDVNMERHSRIAARHLYKAFPVSKPVKRATVYVCGLGYYILKINGQRIGDYLLCPAPTQYDKAAIYDTYDVTEQIENGRLKIEHSSTRGNNLQYSIFNWKQSSPAAISSP